MVLAIALVGTAYAWHRERRTILESLRRYQLLANRYEADLRHTRTELDRSRRARSTFLAAANHDLRQPMQALFCFSAILARRLRGPSRIVAERLQQALLLLNGHIETLVELSRLEADMVAARPMSCAVDELVREVVMDLAPEAAGKGLRLRMVRSGAVIVSDPVLLRRMLKALVANAVRFTSAGGVVVGCRRRGPFVWIEVWDSGIGIAADDVDRIFEEFFQVGNSQRDRANGLGLGLAVVDRLVRLLPGHGVRVRSRPGKGSLFRLEVPAAAPVVRQLGARPQTPRRLSTPRPLLRRVAT